MALKVGRITLPVEPSEWEINQDLDSQSYVFRGFLMADTQANTIYYRDQLIGHHGHLVAVVYDRDPSLTGYYLLTSTRVETVPMSYRRRGLYPFELSLFRIGGYSSTELQSLITTGDRANDFGTTAQPAHGVPVGTLAYDAGPGTGVTQLNRDTADGLVPVYLDIDGTWDPSWSVQPSSYYSGGVYVFTEDLLRTGTELPANDPTDWYMGNGLVEVRAQTYQSTSNGRFEIRPWDGTGWDSWIDFKITWDSTDDVPQWHFMTVVRNQPEACIVSLVRDASTVPNTAHRHTLSFLLRRGMPYVECIYTFSSASTFNHQVGRDSTDAATRPGGTASYIMDAALNENHRWILGAPNDFTANTTNGSISMDVNAKAMPFFVGFVINNAADASGNGPADLAQQYTAPVGETVRGVRR